MRSKASFISILLAVFVFVPALTLAQAPPPFPFLGPRLPAGCSTGQIPSFSSATGLWSCSSASGTGDLKADGTVPLTANWNVGAYTLTASGFVGNASTASALAANPTDCAAGELATGIAANGNLTCSATPSLTALTIAGANSLGLGTAGSAVGSINFKNATTGSITVEPATGALGTPTITLPAQTGTITVGPTSTTAGQVWMATATAGLGAWGAAGAGDVTAATETQTWGAGGASIAWTFNTSGTDVTMTWSSQLLKLNSPIQIDTATGLSLSASGVAHGMTDIDATDKYYTQRAVSGTAGGFLERGFSDDGTTAFTIAGYLGSADPTDTVPAVKIQGYKSNGTSAQALGAAETVFEIQNATTPVITVLGNGTVNIPTGGTYNINGSAHTHAYAPASWIVQAGANNVLTYTGNYSLGLTLTGNTALTLPTSGTLATTAQLTAYSEPATNIPICRTGAGTTGGCTNVTDVAFSGYVPTSWITRAGTNNVLTYTGDYSLGVTLTGNTAVTLPTSGTLLATNGSGASLSAIPKLSTAAATTSAELASVLSDEIGAGAALFHQTTITPANGEGTLTAAQMQSPNCHVSNYNHDASTTDRRITLPAAAANLSCLFTVSTAGNKHWGALAGAGDAFYIIAAAGTISTKGTDAAAVVMTEVELGQSFVVYSIQTGASAWDWVAKAVAIGTKAFEAHDAY